MIQLVLVLQVCCIPCDVNNNNISLNVFLSNTSCSEFHLNNGDFYLEENPLTNHFLYQSFIKVIGKENSAIYCHYNAGLAFKYVFNIVLQNITFHNCGMMFNSTSVNPDSPNNTLVSKAALLFEYCRNLSLSFVTIENSSGVGIQIYNTIGDVSISHCNFVGNKILSNESKTISGGGGIYIEFSYCKPGTLANTCNLTELAYSSHAKYVIKFSNFIENVGSAVHADRVAFIRASNYTHFAFGGGGGLSIYLKGNASCNNFVVINCTFSENIASFGAGMYVELQDTSNCNNFTVTGSRFYLNKVFPLNLGYTGTSGGGVMFDYVIFGSRNHIEQNSATFVDTIFESNAAFNGGGFSFHSGEEADTILPTNSLSFTNCHWIDNRARLGAAIDLGSLHTTKNGRLVKPLFINCTFENNSASGFYIQDKEDAYGFIDANSTNISGGYWPGSGIMYLDAISVDFSSSVKFINNTGGAIVAIGASVNILQNTKVEFSRNLAEKGGAIYLSGYSWISTSHDVNVSFINNSANTLGGAIYAQKSGEHDIVSGTNCFIQYADSSVAPGDWENVSFVFSDNCGTIGGDAIFATTVVDCAWNGSFASLNYDTLKRVFLKWPGFVFNHTYTNCSNFIQTSARSYSIDSAKQHLKIAPGEYFKFPFNALNDFGNSTTAIFSVFSGDDNVNIPNPNVQTDSYTRFTTNETGNFYLQFATVDNRRHVGYINVQVDECPVGFYLYNDTCTCISNIENYEGVARCQTNDLKVYMQPGFWAGRVYSKDNSSFFSSYTCPFSYCKSTNYNTALNSNSSTLCQNRVGTLCGDCAPGYGISISGYECVNCNGSHYTAWIVYVTTTYMPITIVFVILLVLNMNLAVGPVHSFIFYCQIFPAIIFNNNYSGYYNRIILVINDIYRSIINIMSLKFDLQFSTDYCLSPTMTVMDYYLLQYLAALYPLLIMVTILSVIRYCPGCIPIKYFWRSIRRCVMAIRRRTSMQQTVIHGFITFLLLTYTNFVNISFQILAYAAFEDKTGHQPTLKVPFRQGTMTYFGQNHLPYALAALMFLLIFGILPPLLLIMYPAVLSTIGHFGWDDSSTVHTMQRWIPVYKLVPVFDAFWSAFKPNCKVFAGLYFVYRFLAFSSFSFVPLVYQIYFGLSILFAVILFLHAFMQPYIEQTHNRADFVMFLLLCIINSFYAYSEFLRTQKVKYDSIQTVLWIQTLLPWIPIVFIICYILVAIRKAHRREYHLLDDSNCEELLDRVDYDSNEDDSD